MHLLLNTSLCVMIVIFCASLIWVKVTVYQKTTPKHKVFLSKFETPLLILRLGTFHPVPHAL